MALLAVMVSVTAWLYIKIAERNVNQLESRRRITGCELARQVLDSRVRGRVSVTAAGGAGLSHLGRSTESLTLNERVFFGGRLSDLSRSLHETHHLLTVGKSAVPLRWGMAIGRTLRVPLAVSLFIIVMEIFFPLWAGVAFWGELSFLAIFLFALASMAGEWEVTQNAISHLSRLEGFEMDEKIRMKHFLAVLGWAPLAELIAGPLALLKIRR